MRCNRDDAASDNHAFAARPRAAPKQYTLPNTMNATTPASEFIFDATDANFQTEVIERSMHTPVLLDCWAPWCGPCKSLTPVLEKLANDYAGAFVLAKLNSDDNPQLAQALQLRSIPQVFLVKGGQIADQFAGALPEGKVREFLDKHVQSAVSPVEQLREAARTAPGPEAEALLQEALAYDPAHLEVQLDLVELVLARGALDEALDMLLAMPSEPTSEPTNERALERRGALLKRIELMKNRPAGDPTALAARIKANAKDFEARFALAAIQMFESDFKAAFEQLLDVVLRDKADWREKARLQLIEWFALCPDAEAVSHGRRYLGMYLN